MVSTGPPGCSPQPARGDLNGMRPSCAAFAGTGVGGAGSFVALRFIHAKRETRMPGGIVGRACGSLRSLAGEAQNERGDNTDR